MAIQGQGVSVQVQASIVCRVARIVNVGGIATWSLSFACVMQTRGVRGSLRLRCGLQVLAACLVRCVSWNLRVPLPRHNYDVARRTETEMGTQRRSCTDGSTAEESVSEQGRKSREASPGFGKCPAQYIRYALLLQCDSQILTSRLDGGRGSGDWDMFLLIWPTMETFWRVGTPGCRDVRLGPPGCPSPCRPGWW